MHSLLRFHQRSQRSLHPFVTGSAALLMEWGIVRENDPYLYGERMKGYLHRGARRLQGYDRYPNDEIGYGRLCVSESLYQ